MLRNPKALFTSHTKSEDQFSKFQANHHHFKLRRDALAFVDSPHSLLETERAAKLFAPGRWPHAGRHFDSLDTVDCQLNLTSFSVREREGGGSLHLEPAAFVPTNAQLPTLLRIFEYKWGF
jgi:hypothetical protein